MNQANRAQPTEAEIKRAREAGPELSPLERANIQISELRRLLADVGGQFKMVCAKDKERTDGVIAGLRAELETSRAELALTRADIETTRERLHELEAAHAAALAQIVALEVPATERPAAPEATPES
jgi:chromosome segregation ATPase